MWRMSLLCGVAAVLLLGGVTQAARDVTMPGDTIQGVPNDGVSQNDDHGWPGNEAPNQAIDNQIVTKYLHFKGEDVPTGVRITPKAGPSVVTGLNLCTANDAIERDPVKWELSGSNVSIDGPYTLIAQGDIKDFAGGTWPRRTWITTPITFANTVAYAHYQLMFPGVFNPSSANSMQIAEIELTATVLKSTSPEPADGATGVMTGGLLKWTPGDLAAFHDVYVGDSPDLPAKRFQRVPRAVHMSYYTGIMEPGQTYYWRVDDVEKDLKTIHTGDVWSFTVAPLEAYNPNPRDGDKWLDPNVDLTWMPGQYAETHDVYFGTDEAAVAARDASVFKASGPAMTFDPGTLAAKTTYYWAVDETSFSGKVPGPVWSFTTFGGGGGLKGEYYSNTNLSGMPALTRIDPSININTDASPGVPIPVDGWSARWTADLDITVADTYNFAINCQDGTRMWIDGELIIDKWITPTVTSKYFSLPVYLEKGVHPLVVEFFDSGGTAVEELTWWTDTMAEVIVPAGPLQPPLRAKATYPQDNDANIPQDVTLAWSAGLRAVTHDVYFGDDAAAVAAATPADAGVYEGNQALDVTTWSPGALEWNKTYYWRVDEVNDAEADSPWEGSVWSFTTADFLVIDDFESYSDEVTGRIFQTWIDGWGYTEPAPGNPGNGTGATVGYTDPPFSEHVIVHSGGSSMPLAFNNQDSPFYSETEREFDSVQNWTVNGVSVLSLQVRGYPQVTTTAVTETGGKMTLTGSGADIWNNSDEFTFAYKTLNGDATIVAKVTSNGTGSNAWAKGGVMIRDSLDGGSMHAMMVMTAHSAASTAGNGASFQYRATTDGGSGNTDSASVVAPPYWIKLERMGDVFTGYTSADGSLWQAVGSQEVIMTGPAYIGMCVTAHVSGENRTYQFEGIKTTGSVTGQWQGAVIASPKYNSAQDLYVAIQDSSNKIAVVKSATAVNSATWVEVKMPLSDFTGVSMTKVKKMFIGVGDRNNAVPDGSGMLFIDDIRVIKP
ncbi:MAG: hypothetical protein JW955_02030 [Sedimentisphaerales bacterium]|nr:hypothetical protein [Sedimentisphaerales bacterium]